MSQHVVEGARAGGLIQNMAIFKRRHKAPQLQSLIELSEILGEGRPVFVDFYKYGCSPCQIMDGIIDEISEQFDGRATVLKANLGVVPALFEKFNVRSTPTFLILNPTENGLHLRWRHSGLVKKDVLVDSLARAIDSA